MVVRFKRVWAPAASPLSEQLIANGANKIKTTSYPGDHGGAAADCMINSIKWFNTMKQ